MFFRKMGTGFISRQNYTEKRLTLSSFRQRCLWVMICKTQSPLYSIPGSVPRLLHIQNYIQMFRSAKACQKMQRCARGARCTGPQIDTPGFSGMHGTAGRAAHLARTLMMVALLPRGLIGGLGEDPDAVSYPESKHAST